MLLKRTQKEWYGTHAKRRGAEARSRWRRKVRIVCLVSGKIRRMHKRSVRRDEGVKSRPTFQPMPRMHSGKGGGKKGGGEASAGEGRRGTVCGGTWEE